VYAFLTFNIYLFFDEELAAAALQFPNGVAPVDIIEAYSATIDTLAWVVLLLMFELETYALDDDQFTRTTTWLLHGLRAICYAFIVYAFYGYIANLAFVVDTVPMAGVNDVCALLPGEWSWATTLDEYAQITAANCASWSDVGTFVQFRDLPAIVDPAGLTDIIRLAWVDVINAAVWLLVVLVLEIDVQVRPLRHPFPRGCLLGHKGRLRRLLGCLPLACGVRLYRTQCVRMARGRKSRTGCRLLAVNQQVMDLLITI
jgi:hypothetical protein